MPLAYGMVDILSGLSLLALFFAASMVTMNALFVGRLGRASHASKVTPLTSILIPVRNESENLRKLLPALLKSTYEPLEVVILDDESTDDSFAVATSLLADAKFPCRVVRGVPWSADSGLSGKAHACAQLAELASGEILIFCDADVVPLPRAIQSTVGIMTEPAARTHAAGLSALPAQACHGWRQRLMIPWVMHLPLMMSLPLFVSWRLPALSTQMANGQWLALFSHDYFASGGHRSLGRTPLDDVALARRVRQITGRGVRPVLAAGEITTTMYKDWPAMVAGFSKNLVAIGGGSPWVFTGLLLAVNVVFLFPLWGWFFHPPLAALALGLCVLIRFMTARVFNMPARDVVLHPVSLLLLNIASWRSVVCSLNGSYEWKGRVVKWTAT